MLTNSNSAKKRGPKEMPPGNLYGFAHQAYWGFKFLAEKKFSLWEQVQIATRPAQVQELGRICSEPGAMSGAGYGATGLMTWLENKNVAKQILAAKRHRRYPDSDRPSSRDRRMIFLAIAVAAGVWEIEFSTALRKLDQAGLGQLYMAREVHAGDRWEEYLKLNSILFAEPVGNYFCLIDGKYVQVRDLPCEIPKNSQNGFIIHGYGTNGFESSFSWTLPPALADSVAQSESANSHTPVLCSCGAKIFCRTKKLALQALAKHKQTSHTSPVRKRRKPPK